MPLPVSDPARYQEQLEQKAARLRAAFAAFEPPELEVFPSPPEYYRMRTEFRVWRDGDDMYYVMFELDPVTGRKTAVRFDQYPIASRRINELMPALMEAARTTPELGRRLFQVEFLTTTSGEALVTLIYHRPLDDAWQAAARRLQETLGIQIIGRSRKQRLVLARDYVIERLQVGTRTLTYQQVENSFTQPNAEVCRQMLGWAVEVSRDIGGDLVEFYCGNANFTVALAPNFRRVLATEISKTSVKSAEYNFKANGIDNARVVRISSEEFSQALAGTRRFRRLQEAGVELSAYDFSTVLVDPPRAGLDEATVQQVSAYDNIIYISCNPETLHANLATLCQTHRIERFALFDQFPYTDHIESGVLLKRRSA